LLQDLASYSIPFEIPFVYLAHSSNHQSNNQVKVNGGGQIKLHV
jgi:hypothetical protein